MNGEMFGPHLTMDLYSCNKKMLLDSDFILKMLDELPEIIGMTKISEPQIIKYPGKENSFDKGGVSGFVLIAESHISIHTFVAQEYASIDIFSCKPFDVKTAENYFVERFLPKKIEKHLISRGREFPKDVEKAKQIVVRSRKLL